MDVPEAPDRIDPFILYPVENLGVGDVVDHSFVVFDQDFDGVLLQGSVLGPAAALFTVTRAATQVCDTHEQQQRSLFVVMCSRLPLHPNSDERSVGTHLLHRSCPQTTECTNEAGEDCSRKQETHTDDGESTRTK